MFKFPVFFVRNEHNDESVSDSRYLVLHQDSCLLFICLNGIFFNTVSHFACFPLNFLHSTMRNCRC